MSTNLKGMTKDQLIAEATRLAIPDFDETATNADMITVIEDSEAYQSEQAERPVADQGSEADEAENPGIFIVNGVRVDFNGKPV